MNINAEENLYVDRDIFYLSHSVAKSVQHLVGTGGFSVATPLAFLGYLSLFRAFYGTKLFMAIASRRIPSVHHFKVNHVYTAETSPVVAQD